MNLESIDDPAALAWAREWSDKTEARFPRPETQQKIRELLDADDRIPFVSRRGEYLYNFWRDASHPRGIWRRRQGSEWEVLIDVDKLADLEGEDWVWKGVHVRRPDLTRALVKLSRGGADATVVREFDLETLSFVDDGFYLPEAKSDVAWLDADTLLVGTDTGDGSLTTSGYPMRVRRWSRGQSLADAPVIASGEPSDVAVGAGVDHGQIIVERALDFYTTQTQVSTDDGMVQLDLPGDCSAVADRDRLFVLPRTDYSGVRSGGLAVIGLDEFLAGSREFTVLFEPDEHTCLENIAITRNYLVMTVLHDVATRISYLSLDDLSAAQLPGLACAHVVAANSYDGDEIWIAASSPTEPTTLYRVELPGGLEVSQQAPARFDATGVKTRQHCATSADGTKIPYFITGNFSLGKRPTLCGGYGGFEVSLTPGYSPILGSQWLEHGNFYVSPNLRGGGEFGPAWHQQVVKTNRHKVWEDHEAVLRDVVTRGYTTPDQLFIRGGSNGGLLTAGALVQYPDAFGGAVIQVPLTDMLRYQHWLAGASWMAEYGNPDVPAERAAIETWSPLHNVSADRKYPPALVTTSTRDDRVHPAHARLFAKALADAGQPVDYFENTTGGHAGAADNEQVARVESLVYAWLDSQYD